MLGETISNEMPENRGRNNDNKFHINSLSTLCTNITASHALNCQNFVLQQFLNNFIRKVNYVTKSHLCQHNCTQLKIYCCTHIHIKTCYHNFCYVNIFINVTANKQVGCSSCEHISRYENTDKYH